MRNYIIIFIAALCTCAAHASPPIEVYGELPHIREMAISPDGKHVAFLRRKEDKTLFVVHNMETGPVTNFIVENIKPRAIFFVGDDTIILQASDTTRVFGYRNRFEYSGAFAYKITTGKITRLIKNVEGLHPAQSGLGRIVGYLPSEDAVLMPAWMGTDEDADYNLLKVSLKNGRGRTYRRGNQHTYDWIVDNQGNVVARIDINNSKNEYMVWRLIEKKWVKVFSYKSELPPFSVYGTASKGNDLILADRRKGDEYLKIVTMNEAGELFDSGIGRENADIGEIKLDTQRKFLGVEYTGEMPEYEFENEQLNLGVQALVEKFPDDSIQIRGITSDLTKVLAFATGANYPGQYLIYDIRTDEIRNLTSARPDISSGDIGSILTIDYNAPDGLKNTAILTVPPGVEPEKLPMIVLPHGGPASYDKVRFDWMAQYFANRGYLVFQPNFRGSSGYGNSFRKAGDGKWGREMQDDITDGVNALVEVGFADAERMCIAGASYGGYAALAGGAFTPDLYDCIVAIAPVADVPDIVYDAKRKYGRNHWVVSYWKDNVGDPKSAREELREISPLYHADAFSAPVLLLHGKDDLIVPIDQSRKMNRALRSADKDVKLVELRGEDHWLSTNDARLQTLREMSEFIEAHIGAGN